ncbi:MAG: TIGR01777 family protein [Bacteroidia bacterium]|nr:TIGR01777 family protein [Bacteroidia bacterium]
MAQFGKIVLAAGTGQMGKALVAYFKDKCNEIVILSRSESPANKHVRTVKWDGKTLGSWWVELENADVLINLTGKNVNCRYNQKNKKEIIDSRTNSVEVLAAAINRCQTVPKLWIQSASATIYRHAEDRPMTEADGEIGEGFSVEVCKAWENTVNENTAGIHNMRRVILRTSLVLSKSDGVFPRLRNLVKFGLGGKQGNGRQMMSWIHEQDVCRMVEWLMMNKEEGVFNCTAPTPLTNKTFMEILCRVYSKKLAFTSPEWLLKFGAIVIGTETELILKSRWVLPHRALEQGFTFLFPTLESAFMDLHNGTNEGNYKQ